MTIDLAPRNPYGLTLRSSVIIAPGCASALRHPDPDMIGAVATRTALLRPPRFEQTRWGTVPAGVVFDRLPTIGFRSLLQAEAKRWPRSPIPVLLSIAGTVDDLAHMVAQLDMLEGIAGVIVQTEDPDPVAVIAAVRSQTLLPLLAAVPHPMSAQVDLAMIAAELVAAGADGLVACAYGRGSAVTDDTLVDGFVVGPTLLPWTLRALSELARAVSVPLIALGGVADARIARLCLTAGATAVMIDGALYGDPAAPQRIAATLQRMNASDAASA